MKILLFYNNCYLDLVMNTIMKNNVYWYCMTNDYIISIMYEIYIVYYITYPLFIKQ